MRIPYGLDRLPRSIALDDPRLPCAEVADAPLRLNSDPVPADAMPLVVGDHAARVAAARTWLHSLCGDYAPLRRQFIDAYLDLAASCIAAHRDALAARLAPYDGLYAPEDFLWSALRPLPRGWVPVGQQLLPADIVFWNGTTVVAVEVAARETERQRALRAAGVMTHRISPDMIGRLDTIPSLDFPLYWDSQTLPVSPFRRTPIGVPA